VRAAGTPAARHTLASAVTHLRASLREGDLVLTLGAGDVWRVARALATGASLEGPDAGG